MVGCPLVTRRETQERRILPSPFRGSTPSPRNIYRLAPGSARRPKTPDLPLAKTGDRFLEGFQINLALGQHVPEPSRFALLRMGAWRYCYALAAEGNSHHEHLRAPPVPGGAFFVRRPARPRSRPAKPSGIATGREPEYPKHHAPLTRLTAVISSSDSASPSSEAT
jgi:hypothetical protein